MTTIYHDSSNPPLTLSGGATATGTSLLSPSLAIVLLLIAVSWLTTLTGVPDGYWRPKEIAWLVGSLLVCLAPLPTVRTVRLPLALFGLGALALAHLTYRFLWPIVVNASTTAGWTLLPCLDLLVALLLVEKLVRCVSNDQWRQIAAACVCCACLAATYSLCQMAGLDEVTLPLSGAGRQHGGFLGNDTVCANALAGVVPLCLLVRRRWLAVLAVFFLLMTVVLLDSASSLIAASTGLCTYLLLLRASPKVRRMLLVEGITFGAIVLWLAPHSFSIGQRPLIWQATLDAWCTSPHPILGNGPGSFAYAFKGIALPGFPAQQLTHAHQELLQIGLEQGIVGLVLWGIVACGLARAAWLLRHDRVACAFAGALAATLATAQVGFPLHIAPSALTALLAVACLLSGRDHLDRSDMFMEDAKGRPIVATLD